MVRTVVAFENEDVCTQIAGILEKSGVTIRFKCRTGADVKRAVNLMGSGVVICGYKLRDMTADELSMELKGAASFLVMAKPTQLELCENQEIFKLPIPFTPGELRGCVNILMQMDEIAARATIPRRSQDDKALIDKAKELLMRRNCMTEEQAHKFLQHKSMEASMKMADMARMILASSEKR